MPNASRTSLFLTGAIALLGVLVGASWFQTHPPDGDPDWVTPRNLKRSLNSSPSHDSNLQAMSEPLLQQLNEVDHHGLSKLVAVLRTNHGTVKFRFFTKDAPKTSRRIAELIQAQFYDGLLFFRVVPQFAVQTGDPDGLGTGGSGVSLEPEWNARPHIEGAVGLARSSDPQSGDSQFYITLSPQPQLDRNYTVFAQVIEGMDTVRKIQRGDRIVQLTLETP